MEGYKIEHKALNMGEHRISFDVGAELFTSGDYSEIQDAKCRVDIEMVLSETIIELDIAISGEVTVECDRCLEPCLIEIDYHAPLTVKMCAELESWQEEESSEGDIIWLLSSEESIDLAQYIYESIILSLPYQRVHEAGECNPEMVRRFNIITEREFDEMEAKGDSSTIDKKELSKLEALKAKMEEE